MVFEMSLTSFQPIGLLGDDGLPPLLSGQGGGGGEFGVSLVFLSQVLWDFGSEGLVKNWSYSTFILRSVFCKIKLY